MIVAIGAMSMTKIPWGVFDCSSKLSLSSSSCVKDFQHPDMLSLRLRVCKVASRPPLSIHLWHGKLTDRDLLKPKTFANGISKVCQLANIKLYLHNQFYTCKNLQAINYTCDYYTNQIGKFDQSSMKMSQRKRGAYSRGGALQGRGGKRGLAAGFPRSSAPITWKCMVFSHNRNISDDEDTWTRL